MKVTEIKKKGKVTGYRANVSDLIIVTKLYAFHEFSKASYSIRMAESGRTIANSAAVTQRVTALKDAWNDKLDAVRKIHDAASKTKGKTKQLKPSEYALLYNYFVNDPKLPENFSWEALRL